MAIRMTGLQSGLDTDAIIEQLMKAEKTKQTKVENKKTKLEWKKDIWSSLNSKLVSFQQTWASKMRLQSSYKTKKAVSSNENKLVATAKSTTPNGSYNIQVQKLATTQYVTSGVLTSRDGSTVKSDTKLSDLMGDSFKEGSEITINGTKTATLIVDSTTTVGDFVTSCSQAGLTASFDEKQQRMFISSATSGKDGKFSITATQSSDDVVSTRSDLRNALDYYNLSSSDKSKVNSAMADYAAYINSTDAAEREEAQAVLDTLQDITEKNAETVARTALKEQYLADYKAQFITENEDGSLAYAGDADADAALKEFYEMSDDEFAALDNDAKTEFAKNMVEKSSAEKAAAYMQTDETKEKVENIVAAAKAQTALETLQGIAEKNVETAAKAAVKEQYLADYKAQFITENADGSLTYVGDADADAAIKESREMSDEEFAALDNASKAVIAKQWVETTSAKKAAAYMETDEAKEKVAEIVAADESGRNSNIEAMADAYAAAQGADTAPASSGILSVIGLSDIDENTSATDTDGRSMAVIAAQDSVVSVNGAIITGSDNTLEVNGLTLELKDATAPGESINITVSNDTDSVYDMVKDFLKEYNSLLKEMNTMYYADTAKGYDPLTDEQKEEMSDDEIEKWEKKIKDSLLRRDDSLEGVINVMKNAMMGSVTVDGKSYSLASLGIMTSTDYTEKGLLHIYGDADDTVYADKDNKLKGLIDSDPDLVMNILTGLTTNLYNNMSKKMQSTPMSSTLTFYNDKQMTSQIEDYKKQISKWETKLKEMEDRYYSQFTAMEKAMASLQSQQAALSGLFG